MRHLEGAGLWERRGRLAAVRILDRLGQMSDEEIERNSPPELQNLPADFWKEAVVAPPPKRAISLRVDHDVLEWFRARGPRYQTHMNAVLRAYVSRMEER